MKKLAKIILTVLAVFACLLPVSAAGHWVHDSNGWKYDIGNGTYTADLMVTISGDTYVFSENGYMIADRWYYRPNSGDPSSYYFKSSGAMAHSEWIGNCWVSFYGAKQRSAWVDNGRYYVDSEGNWDPSKGTRKTGWKKDAKGWWFDLGDGSYAKNGFCEIDRNLYYFDSSGYMMTGWVNANSSWYYFGSDGAMRMNQWVQGYYLDYDGRMAEDRFVGYGNDFYVDKNGKKAPGWKKDAKGWWYDKGASGYLSSVAWMIEGKWYRFDDQGYLKTGWYEFYGKWYYSDPNTGEMYVNRWCGDYWLDENGMMATSKWVDGGKYYVGADGKWVPGAK